MSSSEVELRDLVLHGRSGSDDIIEGLGDLGVGIDQRSLVRYSRLLARDAKQWLDKPETTHLAFSPVKQMGFVKLVAVVTMYAETPALLDRTLRGLAQCVQQLSTDIGFLRSWEEAVVCIVADGIEKLPSDTAKWLENMGVYCPKLVKRAALPDNAGRAPTRMPADGSLRRGASYPHLGRTAQHGSLPRDSGRRDGAPTELHY